MVLMTELLASGLIEDEHNAEHMSTFKPLLEAIKIDQLAPFVSSFRSGGGSSKGCQVVAPILYGSHHILFRFTFSDGKQWLLKIPATGYGDNFHDHEARALKSEALTMRLLQRETTIPLPEVYAFDASTKNELGCSFILMEYIDAIPLRDLWFSDTLSPESREQIRSRALQDLARAMAQLGKFSFRLGGALCFDNERHATGVGPMKIVDTQAVLDRMRTDEPEEHQLFYEGGPFSDPKSYFLCVLDRRRLTPHDFSLGLRKLTNLFLDWTCAASPSQQENPQDGRWYHRVRRWFAGCASCVKRVKSGGLQLAGQSSDGEFVLAHPDFDLQNILVAEDGTLRGLIDWDGVAVLPRLIGNERYPAWLTSDWTSSSRRTEEQSESHCQPDSVDPHEHTPDEFLYYRSLYRQFLQACGRGGATSRKRKQLGRFTPSSLICENIERTIFNPLCTLSVIEKILDEITKLTTPADGESREGADDFHLWEVSCALHKENLNDGRMERLKKGFARMWDLIQTNKLRYVHGGNFKGLVLFVH